MEGRWTPANLEVTDEELELLRTEASKYSGTTYGELTRESNTESNDESNEDVETRGYIVDETPSQRRAITRQQKSRTYPWEAWMDSNIHEAVRGRDFDMPVPQFQQFLHNKARLKGVVVWTRTMGNIVEFAFFRNDGERYEAIHNLRIQDSEY